jgi:hypothetical protein
MGRIRAALLYPGSDCAPRLELQAAMHQTENSITSVTCGIAR